MKLKILQLVPKCAIINQKKWWNYIHPKEGNLMKKEQINIRDPFVVCENGLYYLYGTRAKDFGCQTGGFDVYISNDLAEWSESIECFDSEKYGLNREVNWAPEVHVYKGRYYMFATFTQENGLRGTYSLVSDSLTGPFVPHSKGALTPYNWECLDGTLYVDEADVPYLVFCHEHTQIIDGTICYARLNEDLSAFVGDVVTMFSASSCGWADPIKETHYVTDGPFMYRSKTGELFMIWSSFVKGNYAEGLVKFKNGKIGLDFDHLKPLLDSDGGHGMIFSDGEKTYFTYHTPNRSGFERPEFCLVEDYGDIINIKN
jgi:GH43 family beta-xylosidase